jgi:hypothetical protein
LCGFTHSIDISAILDKQAHYIQIVFLACGLAQAGISICVPLQLDPNDGTLDVLGLMSIMQEQIMIAFIWM